MTTTAKARTTKTGRASTRSAKARSAASGTPNAHTLPNLETAAEQFRQANDRLFQAGHRIGNAYLETYEKAVDGVVALETRLAKQSDVDVVASLLTAHASLTRELAHAYISTARQFVN